ncbi:unnamed protein product [Prorocentrum cordatum]|uniref:Uncharacterized protein n=1 Tax=Prorocentrum cordatum TaxID=2364126 RepID=A0ABN9Q8S7_9DINO|nr:unnamed protein product [Polarella glacialis]
MGRPAVAFLVHLAGMLCPPLGCDTLRGALPEGLQQTGSADRATRPRHRHCGSMRSPEFSTPTEEKLRKPSFSQVRADFLVDRRWTPLTAPPAPPLARSARQGGVPMSDPGQPRGPSSAGARAVLSGPAGGRRQSCCARWSPAGHTLRAHLRGGGGAQGGSAVAGRPPARQRLDP